MNAQSFDSAALLRAASFAADKHRHQRRKDAEGSPYVNHPLAVACVLATEGDVQDEALLIAALLHDTVEDTNTTIDELEEVFGQIIGELVSEVTDDKSLPKQQRKALQISRATSASDLAKQLKIADKISNLRDIVRYPPSDWTQSRKLEYVLWASQVVDGCRGVNDKLDAVFDEVVNDATAALGTEA